MPLLCADAAAARRATQRRAVAPARAVDNLLPYLHPPADADAPRPPAAPPYADADARRNPPAVAAADADPTQPSNRPPTHHRTRRRRPTPAICSTHRCRQQLIISQVRNDCRRR